MIQNILMEKRNLFANQNEEEAVQNRKPQEITEDIELNIKEEITTRKKEDQGKGVGYTNPLHTSKVDFPSSDAFGSTYWAIQKPITT